MAKNTDIRLRNQLLYSVYVRDYGKNGTFSEVEEDLDRIRELGTDIIWFMPIHPLGVKGRKGSKGSPYAIKDYRAVNPEYGTMEDFIRLTEAIHEKGMKCIIDVVYNHTSPDSVLVQEHPEWFYHDAEGKPRARVEEWWDIVDLDYSHDELWDYQIETLCFWAKYVDGFRCDVAPFLPLEFWLKAREAVENVRPGAFWLAESTEHVFTQRLRQSGNDCLSDADLYRAFDACYDYDVYEELFDHLTGKGPLEKYLRQLNLQEAIYPMNYVKMHFIENHDQVRMAALIPDSRRRRHWLAFSLFQKGLGFIYNGQERSDKRFATLFEKDPIDWSGEDLSDVIRGMMKIKRRDICADSGFEVKEIREGVVRAEYIRNSQRMMGLFSLNGEALGVDAGLENGTYRNEYNGKEVSVFHGVVPLEDDPVIIVYERK